MQILWSNCSWNVRKSCQEIWVQNIVIQRSASDHFGLGKCLWSIVVWQLVTGLFKALNIETVFTYLFIHLQVFPKRFVQVFKVKSFLRHIMKTRSIAFWFGYTACSKCMDKTCNLTCHWNLRTSHFCSLLAFKNKFWVSTCWEKYLFNIKNISCYKNINGKGLETCKNVTFHCFGAKYIFFSIFCILTRRIKIWKSFQLSLSLH